MKFRTNLRSRVSLAFALVGTVVSLTLAGALYLLTTDMEQRLVAETLSAELDDYVARYELDAGALPPTSTTIRTYVIKPDETGIPDALRRLHAGLQRIHMSGRDYYAEVRLKRDRHFIVLYDYEQIRQREAQFKLFLGIGVLVTALLSAFLGFWLAGRVISPVGELATRVANLRPDDGPALLAEDFPPDEVGKLAHEFDAYRQRLAAFIEREQAFTADVSHELRTPLAVIEGAAEVLLDDPDLSDSRRGRVERIARSAHEMCELVKALLLLSREERGDASVSGCEVGKVLKQVVESHKHLLQHKSVDIKLDIQTQMILDVECTLLGVVLANLIRNAITYTERGHISIQLNNTGVSVRDTGIGMNKEQLRRIFDHYYAGPTGGEGIGLSLVKRICQKYNWNIDIESYEEQGTNFRLSF